MPSTGACSASPTRSSCSRRATSSSRPRTGRGCASAASSTRPRRTRPGREALQDGRLGRVHLARGRGDGGAELRHGLRDRLHAGHLRVRDHELAAAALLALAQPHPALPLRRLRAVSAPLPAGAALDGPARPLADARGLRPLGARVPRQLDPGTLRLKERPMALTPVEIRHLTPPRALVGGYRAGATDRLLEEIAASFEDVWRERADLADKVEQLEADLVRFRELESLLRTTLVSAEQASAQMKEQARREAELILSEAHAEARATQRRALAENERLTSESRRLRVQLAAALAALDEPEAEQAADPAADEDEDVEETGEGSVGWYGFGDAVPDA